MIHPFPQIASKSIAFAPPGSKPSKANSFCAEGSLAERLVSDVFNDNYIEFIEVTSSRVSSSFFRISKIGLVSISLYTSSNVLSARRALARLIASGWPPNSYTI